jgi:hypothetical protein
MGEVSQYRPRPAGRQAMTMRLPFFVATGPIVLATSSIKGTSGNDLR